MCCPEKSCGFGSGDPIQTLAFLLRITSTQWRNTKVSRYAIVTTSRLKVMTWLLGVPLLTQSDLGTENYGIANAQTSFRQHLDPELAGTLQHRWERGHGNVKPEISWSQVRKRFSPGFEDHLEYGVQSDIYNPSDSLHE